MQTVKCQVFFFYKNANYIITACTVTHCTGWVSKLVIASKLHIQKDKEQLIPKQHWNLCLSSPTVKSGPSGDAAGYWAKSYMDHDPDFTTSGLKKLCVLYMEENQGGSQPHLTLIHLELLYSIERWVENRQVDKGEKNHVMQT